MMEYLNRDAQLPGELWEAIDETAVAAARPMLTARRFLDLDGPHGVGLTTVELSADEVRWDGGAGQAAAFAGRAVSVPMIHQPFSLSVRRVEAHRDKGQPLELSPVEDAAEAVARREEALLYYGQADLGLEGLLTAGGRQRAKHGDWSMVQRAIDDVIDAVDALDGRGFRGPYALAASPQLYNDLFRRYEQTAMLQVDHLKRLMKLGVFKAPIEGAAVLDPHAAHLVLGQDLRAGFAASNGVQHGLFLSESLVLLIDDPAAICHLEKDEA